MFYALLCYNNESVVGAWSREKDDAVMTQLGQVQQGLHAKGKLGAVARLMPTTAATTVKSSRQPNAEPLVVDGPFAETKEQLLGFYVVNCDSLEEAIAVARQVSHDTGSIEIRPIAILNPVTEPVTG